ncbi:MAG: DnaD domain protein [Bacilli bacterium]|nr:DnaD domain protein [Bacilli bacterium]
MNRYYDLLKNNIIDFNKILLEKYHQIGLNELDAIILMKINSFLNQGEKSVSFNQLVSTMTVDEEQCSERVIDLVNKGFITLEISPKNSKETYSLNELYRKLSFILEGEDEKEDQKTKKNVVKKTIKDMERELKKILTPLEVQMVNKWYFDYNYEYEEVCDALLEAIKNKNRGLAFIDRWLYKQHNKKDENVEINPDIERLFSKVYNGRK